MQIVLNGTGRARILGAFLGFPVRPSSASPRHSACIRRTAFAPTFRTSCSAEMPDLCGFQVVDNDKQRNRRDDCPEPLQDERKARTRKLLDGGVGERS